ncbi:hypothetical protein E3N88_41166 [Mikania micrantha]|uniref:Reverse transcriptase zinc-binding domain-containing protein n=1 Tax=Mikania micrantha TaxID=192012 RepID=A0A5N6LPS5_9ASTR|nr:hypothetical protein E3N88_41166 [Mikania micrantha]
MRWSGVTTELNKLVPKKVNILSWRAELGKIPTRSVLRIKNINIGSLTCKLCDKAEETIDHLFTACQMSTYYLWSKIESWCKLPPLFAFSFRDLMVFHNSLVATKLRKELVLSVLQMTVWCIWKARNDAMFRQHRIIKEKMVDDVKMLS